MKTVFKILLTVTIATILSILLFGAYLAILVKDFKLDERKLTTTIKKIEYYDANNNLFYEDVTGGKNKYISLSELSPHTIDAFISIEDRKFFNHSGIDFKRIVGASINNLKSKSFKEGASTISQQLIKNTHLNSEKTLKRKAAEIKITLELEKKFSKEQILEKYLNTIYFGKNAYGINEASLLYFNKTADKLNLNESCMLAGIIKSPSKYSPLTSYENAINRKNVVLSAMLQTNKITKNEFDKNVNKDVTVLKAKNKEYFYDYVEGVKAELESLIKINPYENNVIKVYTYLDSSVQKNLFDTQIDEVNNLDVNKIVINNKNNGVIAFYGKNSKLKRSPASTVKPWLIYAPMINENYITEASVVDDSFININGYSPKNYGGKYYGNVTVKDALKLSLNVTPVKLLDGFTVKKVNNYTSKMGITIKNEGLSSALGSIDGGMTLKEICDCYSTFNNQGNYLKSSFISKIKIKNNLVYNHTPNKTQVFSEGTAYIINDALMEATKTGTSKKLKDFNYEVSAKSGTNGDGNGNLDAYSISYTTEHIIGVWIGNENNELMPNSITGGGYPTIFNREILKFLYKNHKPSDFEIPKSVIKVNVDKKLLTAEKQALIDSEGESFYFIIGTEPKAQKSLKFSYSPYEIALLNNTVTIKNSSKNCEKLKIIRTFKGIEKVIYDGAYVDELKDVLNEFGIYEYKLVFYDGENNEYLAEPKNIIYSKNSLEITKDDWWNL